MAAPRKRKSLERFGGLNDIRSNSFRERTLDIRNGMGSVATINFRNTLETGYGRDSLSEFGNVFRARVLGVTLGVPSRRRYPQIFNSTLLESGEGIVVKDYFLFFLRMEFDSFTPDPTLYCNTVQQFADLASLQGRAISRVPADEFEPVGAGDIVEVYLPNQNSYDGALVNKVVIRNNSDPFVPPSQSPQVRTAGRSNSNPHSNNNDRNPSTPDSPIREEQGQLSDEVATIFRNNREINFGIWLDRGPRQTIGNLDSYVNTWKTNNIKNITLMISQQSVQNTNPRIPNQGGTPVFENETLRWPREFSEARSWRDDQQIKQISDRLSSEGLGFSISVWPYPNTVLIDQMVNDLKTLIEVVGADKIKAIEFDVEGINWSLDFLYGKPPVYFRQIGGRGFENRTAASAYLLEQINTIDEIRSGAIKLEATTFPYNTVLVENFIEGADRSGVTGIDQWNIQAYSKFVAAERDIRYPGVLQEITGQRFQNAIDGRSTPILGMGLAAYQLEGWGITPYENVLNCVISTIENTTATEVYFWSQGNLSNSQNRNAVYGVTNAYKAARENTGTPSPT